MKKREMLVLVSLSAILILFLSFPGVLSSTIGTLALTVLGDTNYGITIYSPLNQSYSFSSVGVYTLNLSVGANFTVDKWWYKHEELTHNTVITSQTFFTPNTTINVYPRSNRLTVFANVSNDGTIVNKSVVFYASVPNSAPVLSPLSNDVFACESNSLFYNFNASDIDEDNLIFDISPKDPFYARSLGKLNYTLSRGNLFSGTLSASQEGKYSVIVSASDGEYVDTQNINISVIEINNLPSFPNIGVQTIYAVGEGSNLYLVVNATDEESGNRTDGNLTFNSTILDGPNLFNISSQGVINYTPSSYASNVYNVEVCVYDQGLDVIHPNISYCGQDGGQNEVCDNFELTITSDNRAPTIVDYSPGTSINENADSTINLFISSYDPDGTTPDAYWYVDGNLLEYDSGNLNNTFSYSFGCGSSGSKVIRVDITDGLLNDSLTWNIDLNPVACPVSSSGGGGGGGSGVACLQEWACKSWQVCENLETGLSTGLVKGLDYRDVKDRCTYLGLEEERCGYQIRECQDLNECGINAGRPTQLQECVYTENPSCTDGIKNCHNGDCELLVDCGGPCQACATCSDGIKNRGEEGVDCGGPCPRICALDSSRTVLFSDYSYILWIVLLLFIIVLIYKLLKVGYISKRLKE